MDVSLEMRNRKAERKNKSKLSFDFKFSGKNYFQVLSLPALGRSDFVISRTVILCYTVVLHAPHALWGFSADCTPGALDTMAPKFSSTGRLGNQFFTFQVMLLGSIHINFSAFDVKRASR